MNKYIKNFFLALINILIIYFFIFWFSENIDITKLKQVFSSVSMLTIFIVFFINFLTLLFYSKRLSTIINKSIFTSFLLVNLGYGLNSIFPFRIGDIVKLIYGKKIFFLPSSLFILSIFIEKFLDIIILGFLISIVITFSVQNYIKIDILFIIIGLLLGIFLFIYIANKYLAKLNSSNIAKGRIKFFLISIYEYSKGHDIKKLIFESFLIWMANIVAIYITFNFLLENNFSLMNAMILMIIIVFSIAIPATPASIGIFEAGIVAYLVHVLNVNNEVALVSAIIFHMSIILPQIFIMLLTLVFWKYHKEKKYV